MIHLDTHVLIWLATGHPERLPAGARARIEAERPLVSPMVQIELALMYEIRRVGQPPGTILDVLRRNLDLGWAEASFERVSAIAATLTWTRDPFDRVIVAHALADDLPLLTKDEILLRHCRVAVWD